MPNLVRFTLFIFFLFFFSVVSFAQAAFTPEEGRRVKEWIAAHPEVIFMQEARFAQLPEAEQLQVRSMPNMIFHTKHIRWKDIECYENGTRRVFPLTQSEQAEQAQIQKWKANNPDVYVLSQRAFDALYPEKKEKVLNMTPRALIYPGKVLRLADIQAYDNN
jgi:hypothetical protein